MEIIQKKVAELIPYAKNTKKHDKKQIANVAERIRQYGFVQPVVVDKDGVIVIGHCRVLGAKKLGMKEVPCVCVDDLTPEQVNALRIVDNKSNESEWDMDYLAEELPDLDLSAFDFDFGIKFDEEESAAVDDEFEAEIPEEPYVKVGDLYQLGRHRLLCGDSTKMDDVQRLMGGEMADLLLTDPPYNVALGMGGSVDEARKRHRRTDGLVIMNDKMEDSDFYNFLLEFYKCAHAVMKPGAVFYIWHADNEGLNFRKALKDAGLQLRQTLIWNKNSITLGRQDYQWKHEPCLYGWKEGAGHLWASDRKQSTVMNFDRPAKSELHPTMKPIPLFDYQIKNNTKGGDIVLDLFGGSGTTIMACEQNGRRGFSMEFDPRYAQTIIQRWETFTGEKAVLLND